MFDHVKQVEDLERFQRRAVDPSFLEQYGGIEEAVEAEAAPSGEHGADLGGPLLLLVDPDEVGGGLQGERPGPAEGRSRAGGDVVAQPWPFERLGAGFGEGCRDRRE